MSNVQITTEDELKLEALFVPCDTKEDLKNWIELYLGIDMPDCTVDSASNSNPMDAIWEIYAKGRQGNDEAFSRVLVYSARDAFKTLCASIIETLCVVHLNRNVAHMAAIETQAKKGLSYLKSYFGKAPLNEFVTSDNKRTVEITKYVHRDGHILSPKRWEALLPEQKAHYTAQVRYIVIVIATLSGANSEHVPFMTLDELDLANPEAVAEAKFIPSIGPNGELPITLLTSTRKFSFGLVQKEIDDAAKTGLNIRHWNIIDVTQACPTSRHLPDEPKVIIYRSDDTLKAIEEHEYLALDTAQQNKYVAETGYAGCLKNCKLFAVCKGRLATEQKSKSPLLKPIAHVSSVFKNSSEEKAKAQLMCWKPSKEGLIYPRFERDIHVLSASQMIEKITGEPWDGPIPATKEDLIRVMESRNMRIYTGMDFGFTHNFAAVTGGLDGHRLFIFDVIAVAGLELTEKIELCKRRIFNWKPTIYPDPAYPSDIKTFKKSGFTCIHFTKDVLGGIESVRKKLAPGLGMEPELYILSGDDGCELLIRRLSGYHWVLDAAGNPTDEPTDKDDDECDALRYLCQNLFGTKTKFVAATTEPETNTQKSVYNTGDWMNKKVKELTGGEETQAQTGSVGKKGSFSWDM